MVSSWPSISTPQRSGCARENLNRAGYTDVILVSKGWGMWIFGTETSTQDRFTASSSVISPLAGRVVSLWFLVTSKRSRLAGEAEAAQEVLVCPLAVVLVHLGYQSVAEGHADDKAVLVAAAVDQVGGHALL
jgi:hypothetical protein